jgi:hypothetical protein
MWHEKSLNRSISKIFKTSGHKVVLESRTGQDRERKDEDGEVEKCSGRTKEKVPSEVQ